MEFILFRLIQLMKRELLILDEIQTCFTNSPEGISDKNRSAAKKQANTPEHLAFEIQQLELDKKEECLTIAKKLKLPTMDWNLCQVLKEVSRVMDRSNFLLVSLYNDLINLIRIAKCKNSSLQKSLYHLTLQSAQRKVTIIPAAGTENWPATSQKIPLPVVVEKSVSIILN